MQICPRKRAEDQKLTSEVLFEAKKLNQYYLEQQQASGQTGHQQQVVLGPPYDLIQAADGEDVPTGRFLLQLLHPITAHGVQDGLQKEESAPGITKCLLIVLTVRFSL